MLYSFPEQVIVVTVVDTDERAVQGQEAIETVPKLLMHINTRLPVGLGLHTFESVSLEFNTVPPGLKHGNKYALRRFPLTAY